MSSTGCISLAALAVMALASAPAHSYTRVHGAPVWSPSVSIGIGWHGGHHHRGWGGVWLAPAWPRYVWAAPPVVVFAPPPVVAVAEDGKPPPVLSARPSAPDPILYPRNGQCPEQTESDRRECNRWATTQPTAMADSSVFNRAVDACLDGRGYTVR
jgi:hypothetical protein